MSRRQPARGAAAPEPFAAAMSALAACGDAAAAAGHSLASTYVSGAAGNLRHALACLSAGPADDGFDLRRVGSSELIGADGVVDTIRNCRMPCGRLATVRALVATERPEDGIWLRSDPALRHLGVRGSVRADDDGLTFHDGHVPGGSHVSGPDLARDLLATGLHLSCLVEAAAWELSLAAGSWVHLASGRRWYADRATARAVVRALGGLPTLSDAQARRIGAVVDRDVLIAIEALGWRQWSMPSVDGA